MGADKTREEIVQLQYRQRFEQGKDYRNALWRVLCRDFFQQYIARSATVLDLGCGWGEFSNNVMAGKKYAMDMNPDAAHRLHSDVELVLQDCAKPVWTWFSPAISSSTCPGSQTLKPPSPR